MKIALVTHNVVRGDGQGRVNYELVRYCRSVGIGVEIIAEKCAPELLDTGAIWHQLSGGVARPELLHGLQLVPRVARAVDRVRNRVDLVVANGALVRLPHAVNVCHFVHGAWLRSPMHDSRVRGGPYGWYQSAYSRCNARWERQAFNAAKIVVAVSEQVRNELVSVGISKEKIRVIVNGVDLDEFYPGHESRTELGLPATGPLALFVGNIRSPRKNLDSVLRAIQRLPHLQLAVVGDESKSPFPAMAQKLAIQDRVHFLGFRRDVARIMRACDLFTFPSRYEACSLVLLETLAAGLPVVTAATAGGSELVAADCGRVLADPEDLEGLIGGIQELLEPQTATQARRAARRVAEKHGWANMGQEYVRLFHEQVQTRQETAIT